MGRFVVVGGHRIDDFFGLAVTAQQIGSDQRVSAFDFVIDGLTNVVQQAGALGIIDGQTQFPRHQTHEMCHFD